MPIYRRINGVWVPQTVYRRINGAWVQQTTMMRISGSWVDLAPPPPLYTWKQYNVITQTTVLSYNQTQGSGGSSKESIGGSVYSSFSWDSSSGTYSAAGSSTGIVSGGYSGFGSSMTHYSFLYFDTDSAYAWFSITIYGSSPNSYDYTYSMGSSTGVEKTSTNPNAYPADGRAADGYWYVKQ